MADASGCGWLTLMFLIVAPFFPMRYPTKAWGHSNVLCVIPLGSEAGGLMSPYAVDIAVSS